MFQPIEKSSDVKRALDSVTWYLARRDHSELELSQKMKRRYTDEAISSALTEAKARGWILPPQELSERLTESLHRKNKGHKYIEAYLKKRGLPLLPSDEGKELEKGQHLLKMKFKHEGPLDFAEKQKAYRFLAFRGFEDSIIKKVIYEKY